MLIDVPTLRAWLSEGRVSVFDCRFDLASAARGRECWLEGHIPGAHHADLDQDLAGPVTAGSGRHPLPTPAAFADFLARSGWTVGQPVVAYDAQGGAFAARLWWLMRYFGHDCVTLLDGGWGAWLEAGEPVQSGSSAPVPAAVPVLKPQPQMVIDVAALQAGLERGELALLDARDADRFQGKSEPIDAVAGHVPGACNRPFSSNLAEGQRWRAAEEIKADFEPLLARNGAAATVHMCGSGVTACHNLFAMEYAQLPGSRLYVGSWSEWIRNSQRPVATGR